jgi:hypothetical protein
MEAIVRLWFREKNCGRLKQFSEDKILNFAIIGARFNPLRQAKFVGAFF